jgi:hypothetical protein
MVRVYRLFDLGFTRYPRRWITALVAAAIYRNFFTHHWIWDARWVLLAIVVLLWARTVMYARIWRSVIRMPLLAAFAGVRAVHLPRREHRHVGGGVGVPRSARRVAAGLDHEARVVVPADDHLGRAGGVGVPAACAGRRSIALRRTTG